MTEIRTTEETLVAIDRVLVRWAAASIGVLVQASTTARSACQRGQQVVAQQRNRAASLEQQLRSAEPEARPPIAAALAQAQIALEEARKAAARLDEVERRLTSLERTHRVSIEGDVNGARADLSRRVAALDGYYALGRGATNGGSAFPPSTPAAASGGSWLASRRLTEIEVNQADFSDNPILGGFGRGDARLTDYRWAVQTWTDVVRPGVAAGQPRENFEHRDRERGAVGYRRTTAVYDLFLGDADRLRVTKLPDGRLNVTNGRHRLEAARQLGIDCLPAQVYEL